MWWDFEQEAWEKAAVHFPSLFSLLPSCSTRRVRRGDRERRWHILGWQIRNSHLRGFLFPLRIQYSVRTAQPSLLVSETRIQQSAYTGVCKLTYSSNALYYSGSSQCLCVLAVRGCMLDKRKLLLIWNWYVLPVLWLLHLLTLQFFPVVPRKVGMVV